MHFKITNKNVAKIITIRIKLEVAARFGISVCLLLSRFLHIFSMGILHVQIRIFILFIKLGQTPSFKYHSFKWFLHRHQCRDTHRHSHITNSCFLTNTRHAQLSDQLSFILSIFTSQFFLLISRWLSGLQV